MDKIFVLILMFEKCRLFYCTVNNHVTLTCAACNKVSIFLPALASHISVFGNDIFCHHWIWGFKLGTAHQVSELVVAKQSFWAIAHKLSVSAWVKLDAGAELWWHLCRLTFRNVKPLFSEGLYLDGPFIYQDTVTSASHKDS